MSQKIASIALAIALSCLAPTLHAQAVWQCSRIQVDDEALSESEKDDSFSIASMSAAVDVINLSLRDLADVYSGRPVRVGGLPLTACFMSIDHPLTVSALETLGLNASVLKTLARKSAIVHSHLYWVSDESLMEACIASHFPAVGYMARATQTDKIAPCY
jgi:hypothetical protein